MRFRWRDGAQGWETDGGPHRESGAGPAGPAGVVRLRVGGATVSTCVMTGRVTHAWFPHGQTVGERALHLLVFGVEPAATSTRHRVRTTVEVATLPVTARAACVRWAHLRQVVRAVDLRQDPVAHLFARLEVAAALTDVRQSEAGRVAVSAGRLADSVLAADLAVARFRRAPGGVDRAVGAVRRSGVTGLVTDRLRAVAAAVSAARAGSGLVCQGTDRFLAAVHAELAATPPTTATTSGRSPGRSGGIDRTPMSAARAMRWRSHAAATVASRAGWVAWQRGRSGAPSMTTAAGLVFAEAVVAWLQLGDQFKARWAWELADQDEVRSRLTSLGLPPWAPTAPPAPSGAPGDHELLPPPLWTSVVSVNHLLPRPRVGHGPGPA